MNRKTRSFVKKNWGIADLRKYDIYSKRVQGFKPREANGFGWSTLAKFCLRYCSNALIDPKLITEGGFLSWYQNYDRDSLDVSLVYKLKRNILQLTDRPTFPKVPTKKLI